MDTTIKQLGGWGSRLVEEHGLYDVTYLGHWMHRRNRETGEGFWVWCGPEKKQTPQEVEGVD